jgi:hypothetical protein
MTQQVPERQRKGKLPQVSLQDNFNPVGLIKSQETLASSTKSVTKSWPVTAPGSQGVFRGRGRGFGFLKNGRQAAIVLSWLLLVQLPGQVL